MESLKQKTVTGVLWSSIDNFAVQGITFIVGIILARLLEPKEFGLIGMVTIFIALAEAFINGAFSESLIRKKDCTQNDYSTVFYYNLAVGILFFIILYFSASAISRYFDEPQLKKILRVLSIVLILGSFGIIQNTILRKRVDFKLLTKISLVSSIVSGIIAIVMAYKGMGIWSLVALRLMKEAFNSILLWIWNRWRPGFIFSKVSFKELFGFGSKLLLSGLLDALFRNIYFPVIGKYFSAAELGYYTRANAFSTFPAQNINSVINRVAYPVLAHVQDDHEILKQGYRRLVKSVMLIVFPVMLGLAATAEPVVIILIGEKWRQSILYLQILCFAGMLFPLHALNLDILQVVGRSDLILRLEIIKKALTVPVIVLGILFGIRIMILGLVINSFAAYYINSFWTGRLINYSILQQIKDIIPFFLVSAVMALLVFILGKIIGTITIIGLAGQIILGMLVVVGFFELKKNADYLYIKNIALDLFPVRNKRN